MPGGSPTTTPACRASSRRAHARLMAAENTTGEIAALRDERDQVRARVATMLEQLEGLVAVTVSWVQGFSHCNLAASHDCPTTPNTSSRSSSRASATL